MRNLYYLVSPERKKNAELADQFQSKSLKDWIDGLPLANHGMTTRMFHDRIGLMNQTELDSVSLLAALEALHPVYSMIEEFLLSRLVGKCSPLSSDEQKIAQLAETVTKDFITGYGIVLAESARSNANRRCAKSLPLVLARLIRGLSHILRLRFLLRLPDPEWLWLDLHGLYLLAEQKNKHDIKFKDSPDGRAISVEILYKQILLLRLADPWGLGNREIMDLYDRFEEWSELAELQPGDFAKDESVCTVSVDEDKPPASPADRDSQNDPDFRIYTLQLANLFRRLAKILEDCDQSIGRFDLVTVDRKRVNREPAELLRHLEKRWGGIPPDRHNLFEDRKPRLLSIGLKASHQQLSPPSDPGEKIIGDWLVTVNEDQALRCEFDQPGQLFVGSLISLKIVDQENAPRVLGVVTRIWMKRPDSAVFFDVDVLSPQVHAAGIQPVLGKKDLQVFQRVLLFFNGHDSKQTANLILESQKLKNGNSVQLLTQNETVKVLLENRKNVGPGYSHFECVPVAQEKKEVIPAKGYDFL